MFKTTFTFSTKEMMLNFLIHELIILETYVFSLQNLESHPSLWNTGTTFTTFKKESHQSFQCQVVTSMSLDIDWEAIRCSCTSKILKFLKCHMNQHFTSRYHDLLESSQQANGCTNPLHDQTRTLKIGEKLTQFSCAHSIQL